MWYNDPDTGPRQLPRTSDPDSHRLGGRGVSIPLPAKACDQDNSPRHAQTSNSDTSPSLYRRGVSGVQQVTHRSGTKQTVSRAKATDIEEGCPAYSG